MPDRALRIAPCIIVTRPQPQADAWVARLGALGASACALPLLQVQDDPAFAPAVMQAWHDLAQRQLVMFVSPNAVLRFFAHRPAGQAWPQGVQAAATGPGTVAALREAGVPMTAIAAPRPDAPRFDAEALWVDALSRRHWAGRSVLIVRGEAGRDWLADTLRQAGAEVHFLCAYRQQPPAWDAGARALLDAVAAQPQAHRWLFSSSSAIGHLSDYLAAHLAEAPLLAGVWAVPALATHPRIAETARAAGFVQVGQVPPDPQAVLDALRR